MGDTHGYAQAGQDEEAQMQMGELDGGSACRHPMKGTCACRDGRVARGTGGRACRAVMSRCILVRAGLEPLSC